MPIKLKPRGLTALLGLALLLGGCGFDSVQSALDPQAPIARQQMWLFNYTFWLSLIVIAGVGAALVYAIVRYRDKGDEEKPPTQTHGNAVVEASLILVATAIAVAVAVPSVATIFRTETRVEPDEADVVINVTGYQWWWEIEYPDYGVLTANELHIPKGARVILNLDSADVLHSFWAPKLAGKRDLIPNNENQLWFVTDENTETGVYYGECAELCLGAHAYMRFRVVVDEPEDFEAWIEGFQSIEPLGSSTASANNVRVQESDPLIEQGSALFKSKGCAACHAVKGFAGGAPDKPNLTNFGLRTSVAAGVFDNTPENLALWLRQPQEVKPGNYMPTLWPLPSETTEAEEEAIQEEVNAIVAYLQSLGTSSSSETQASLGGSYGN